MKIHALANGSGLVCGFFAWCGLDDPKEWNEVEDNPKQWRGVTCKRCLRKRWDAVDDAIPASGVLAVSSRFRKKFAKRKK